MKSVLPIFILGSLVILGIPLKAYTECAPKWLYYQSSSAIHGPYTSCDTTAVDGGPGNYWCATNTVNIYYAQKGFGTNWTTDCSKCVQGTWFYAHDGEISGGPNGTGYVGCTTEFSDKDSAGNDVPWCPSITAPTYITNQRLGTNWEGCTPQASLSSCPNMLPDPNKCNIYTCNESTGTYQVSSKVCGENEVCEEANGNCVTTCKTYSVPGVYTVKSCDKIVVGQSEVLFQQIKKDEANPEKFYQTTSDGKSYEILLPPTHVKLRVRHNFGDNKLQTQWSAPALYELKGPYHFHDYTKYGLYFSLAATPKSVGGNVAILEIYDCPTKYNKCLAGKFENNLYSPSDFFEGKINPKDCQLACAADANIPQFDYATTPDIRVVAPKGYGIMAKITAKMAQNCYNKMAALTGHKSVTPITFTFIEGQLVGCKFGSGFGNVLCWTDTALSDKSLDNPDAAFFTEVKPIDEGACYSDKYEPVQIFGNLPHEMAHNFVQHSFSAYQMGLSEGLATFIDYEIDTTAFSPYGKLNCSENGYFFTYPNGNKSEIKPYGELKGSNYWGGACFWREIRDVYGPDKLIAIFKKAKELPMNITNGIQLHLFQDVIHPVLQDNTYDKFKQKYSITTDPMIMDHWQFFFN